MVVLTDVGHRALVWVDRKGRKVEINLASVIILVRVGLENERSDRSHIFLAQIWHQRDPEGYRVLGCVCEPSAHGVSLGLSKEPNDLKRVVASRICIHISRRQRPCVRISTEQATQIHARASQLKALVTDGTCLLVGCKRVEIKDSRWAAASICVVRKLAHVVCGPYDIAVDRTRVYDLNLALHPVVTLVAGRTGWWNALKRSNQVVPVRPCQIRIVHIASTDGQIFAATRRCVTVIDGEDICGNIVHARQHKVVELATQLVVDG